MFLITYKDKDPTLWDIFNEVANASYRIYSGWHLTGVSIFHYFGILGSGKFRIFCQILGKF